MPCFLSQVLILDEPASGLDPLARRDAWELLRSYRKGRTILLSTHYVQEADYIFDRVAFMVDGRLRCCGTPTALKQEYGYVVALISTYKFKRAFVRHDRRTAPKFGTHVRIETRLALPKKIDQPHPRGV